MKNLAITILLLIVVALAIPAQQAGDGKLSLTPGVNAQTGTTYTLVASDVGKIVTFNNASAITVTCPTGLGAGFNCTVIQIGAGQVTFSAGASATVTNKSSYTKTSGTGAVAAILSNTDGTFYTAGDMQ